MSLPNRPPGPAEALVRRSGSRRGASLYYAVPDRGQTAHDQPLLDPADDLAVGRLIEIRT
jgi:hypothetical protein